MPSTAAIASTFSRPSSDSIDGQTTILELAHGAYSADRRILGFPHDGARLIGVIHLRDLDAHDPLIEDARDEMHERFVDAHDRRHASSLEPAGEIGDRLKIEGAVLVIDRAVIEAGRLDYPRNCAR